ncbi:hypothetical protein ABIE67_007880 [Streptomyces sp. V4I8]|uniref:hypothetical protein n=1 Tax=Streptomyces sp. V4I8 TaxID=3156469 RepID=UPI00351609A7
MTDTTATDRHERYATAIRTAGDTAYGNQPFYEAITAAVIGVADAEQSELRRERDLAIAHDRQPYPTAWAYEQACKAREKHRERAEAAEAVIADVQAKHKPRTERHGAGCVQCGTVWPCATYRDLDAVGQSNPRIPDHTVNEERPASEDDTPRHEIWSAHCEDGCCR